MDSSLIWQLSQSSLVVLPLLQSNFLFSQRANSPKWPTKNSFPPGLFHNVFAPNSSSCWSQGIGLAWNYFSFNNISTLQTDLIMPGQQSDSVTALAVESDVSGVASFLVLISKNKSFSLLEKNSAGLQICRGSKLSPSQLDSPLPQTEQFAPLFAPLWREHRCTHCWRTLLCKSTRRSCCQSSRSFSIPSLSVPFTPVALGLSPPLCRHADPRLSSCPRQP